MTAANDEGEALDRPRPLNASADPHRPLEHIAKRLSQQRRWRG